MEIITKDQLLKMYDYEELSEFVDVWRRLAMKGRLDKFDLVFEKIE